MVPMLRQAVTASARKMREAETATEYRDAELTPV
jgi:hypothetical protein